MCKLIESFTYVMIILFTLRIFVGFLIGNLCLVQAIKIDGVDTNKPIWGSTQSPFQTCYCCCEEQMLYDWWSFQRQKLKQDNILFTFLMSDLNISHWTDCLYVSTKFFKIKLFSPFGKNKISYVHRVYIQNMQMQTSWNIIKLHG